MKTIPQGHLPVRTLVLIGMVILITAQAYAQNANARLTLTLRNATLKEFVKRIENSTGYSFISVSYTHLTLPTTDKLSVLRALYPPAKEEKAKAGKPQVYYQRICYRRNVFRDVDWY